MLTTSYFDKENLLNFLQTIDQDFTPKLSEKVNLDVFINKIVDNANIVIDFENNEIRGLLVLYCNDSINKYAYISLCGVIRQYRGMGLAKKLLLKAIDIVKDKNYITLGVHSNNLIAIELYRKLGFKIISFNSTKEELIRYYLELKI